MRFPSWACSADPWQALHTFPRACREDRTPMARLLPQAGSWGARRLWVLVWRALPALDKEQAAAQRR